MALGKEIGLISVWGLIQCVLPFNWTKAFHIHQFWLLEWGWVCSTWAEWEANKTNSGIILHLRPRVWAL